IIGILSATNGAIYATHKNNTNYYEALKRFSNHLESLYQENWDNLTEEVNEYFKCTYEKKITEYNTVQLKVVGEISGEKIEVYLEKSLKDYEKPVDSKPVAIITMWPETNITDETDIAWSHEQSYDPNGYEIVSYNWKNKKTRYPPGTHTVWLQVQNSIGIWSDWTSKTFDVVSAIPDYGGKIPIKTVQCLINVNNKLDADYIVINDIDLSGLNWVPIGSGKSMAFTGSIDGNGHVIKNLTINRPNENNVGLFARFEGAKIENMILENVNIIGRSKVGGLVGESNYSTVIKSHVTGNIVGKHQTTGALIGEANYSAVIKSYSKANVAGGNNIIGFSNRSSTQDSYAVTDVAGSSNFVGGLIGRSLHSSVINTYAAGRVAGHVHSGGLIGQAVQTDVINSYYDENVSGQSDTGKGEPRSTKELKQKSTFEDWNFENVWQIEEGKSYPFLR
ncbi:MAG: hypothetical protein WBI47_10750, partial [Atribacterales bacterium]